MMRYDRIDPDIYLQSPDALAAGDCNLLPRHEPPSEQTLAALHNPQYVDCGKATLAAYTFTQETSSPDKPPLVAILPFTENDGTASQRGFSHINALVAHTNRTIVALDMPTTGSSNRLSWYRCLRTSIGDVAGMANQALDGLGITEVDFLGICLGGAIAAQAAIHRGERTRNLITIATPGFENDLLYRLHEQKLSNTPEARADKVADRAALRNAALHDRRGVSLLRTADLPPLEVSKARRKALTWKLGTELLGTAALMQTVPGQLHPKTYWHDFVGEVDLLTSWQNHVRVTAPRPHSRQVVIRHAGHNWPLIRMPQLARLVEMELTAVT